MNNTRETKKFRPCHVASREFPVLNCSSNSPCRPTFQRLLHEDRWSRWCEGDVVNSTEVPINKLIRGRSVRQISNWWDSKRLKSLRFHPGDKTKTTNDQTFIYIFCKKSFKCLKMHCFVHDITHCSFFKNLQSAATYGKVERHWKNREDSATVEGYKFRFREFVRVTYWRLASP